MRTMYDSTNPNAIPTTAQMVAGYVRPSGFTWPQSAWDRFPNSVHVRITPQVSTTGLGIQVLDVEAGDATPAQAPGWAAKQRALGQDPTIYCSASAWATVQQQFAQQHVGQPHYWIAAYPGGGPTSLPALNGITAVAHQYAGSGTSGGDYDLSVVADYWPGVDGGDMLDPTNPNDATVIAGAQSCLPGILNVRNAGDLFLLCYNTQLQVQALAGALAADDTAILAAVAGADSDMKAGVAQLATAITTEGAPQVSEAELQAALAALNLGPATASALVALLAKAAG